MQQKFNLQPSAYLATALIATHGIAMAALLSLALPFWAHGLLILLLLTSLLYYLKRNAWLSAPSSVIAVLLNADKIELIQRGGTQIVGGLSPYSLISPLMTVLNVSPQNSHRAYSIVVLPDSLDAEDFRQLRVCLKWGHRHL